MIMKLFVLAALISVSTVLTLNALPKELQWISIMEALDVARMENKKIVLDVYTDWCGWCKRMDRDVYANAKVADYMNQKFVASKMNPEKRGNLTYSGTEYTLAQFGQALGIRGYPATVFFNEKGEVLTMVAGYIKADEFLKILTYFGDDHYLQQTYDEYSAKHQ